MAKLTRRSNPGISSGYRNFFDKSHYFEMNRCSNGGPIPVGFRFHPTDEELVGYYLHGKVGRAQRDQLIQELDLYKLEPWDLHEVCRIGDDAPENQSDWYFFSHKDKKYPTGNRANRATTAGFWKATGRDKPIYSQRSSHNHNIIGMRKTLVFYRGRAPHGLKTDWIMHEFRLDDGPGDGPNYELDRWVVCRVFRKAKSLKTKWSQDKTTSCSFEGLDHPQSQLILAENFMSSSTEKQLLTNNVARGSGSSEVVEYPLGHLHDHFNLTCKQEISVDDYGTTIHDPDSPFTVDSRSSTLHHLHDQLHRTLLEGTVAGQPPLMVPPSRTSSSSLIRRCLQEAASACRTGQKLADHDKYYLVPALLNHGDSSYLRVDLDDARSSVTQKLAGSCSSAKFPALNNVVEEFWMLEPSARDNFVVQTRFHRAAGDLGVQQEDQTSANVTSCQIHMKGHADDVGTRTSCL